MWTKPKSVLVLLLIVLQKFGQTEAACSCAATTCDCSGIRRTVLSAADIPVPTNTTVLTFQNSGGTFVNAFLTLPQLRRLTLHSNSINSISSGSFANFPMLQELSLSYNNITSIGSDTFSNLTQLLKLSLSNNQITFIGEGAFSYLPRLQQLEVRSNTITSINRGAFANLTQLQCAGPGISTGPLMRSDIRFGDFSCTTSTASIAGYITAAEKSKALVKLLLTAALIFKVFILY